MADIKATIVFGDFLPQEVEQVGKPEHVPEPKKKPFAWGTVSRPTPISLEQPSQSQSPSQKHTPVRSRGPSQKKRQGAVPRAAPANPVMENKEIPQPPKKTFSWNNHSIKPSTPTQNDSRHPPTTQPSTPVKATTSYTSPVTSHEVESEVNGNEAVKTPAAPPKKPFKWGDHIVKPAEPALDKTPATLHEVEPTANVESEAVKTPAAPPKKPFKWGDQIIKPAEPVVPIAPVTSKELITFEEAFEAALRNLDLNAAPHELQKRGFVNQGNTCFQNVTLQALLACPPFLNLLFAIASTTKLPNPKYPAWSHMAQLAHAFEEPTLSLQTTLRKAPKKAAFTMPSYFLNAFQCANGTQEDALEFLEFVLDHLHTEFERSPIVFPNMSTPNIEDDGWEEIQKNGRVGVVHHNLVESESPITHLFKGTLRSEVRSGRKVSASTIEPFHCLHLTMTTTPQSLEEMIASSMADEVLETRGIKRTFFESLPVVLTCHIKRFTYDPKLGPLKLNTFVEYPFKLELPTAHFSPKLKKEKAVYKLFAVIAHHGMEAIGGHYTMICCDVMDQWSCFDDDTVVPRTKEGALQENAYLLFYKRVN